MISCGAIVMLASCDLQPRILSLPDTVGDFISARYPALLADPDTQPEIYNSAAADYGVYASPELYGGGSTDDYLLYASADDYVLGPQDVADQNAAADAAGVGDAAPVPETDVGTYGVMDADASDGDMSDTTPSVDDYLYIPMYGGGTADATITVARGDTLYALARRHNMTVDELARINNLTPPYALKPGQTLRLASRGAAKPVASSGKTSAPTTTTVVELQEIRVAPGDTLYSLSRKYATPVNDLAVLNKLRAPFALSVGQKLKVPKLDGVPVRAVVTPSAPIASGAPSAPAKDVRAKDTPRASSGKTPAPASSAKPGVPPSKPSATPASRPAVSQSKSTNKKPAATTRPQEKISSDPTKKLPAISPRSSSKFSWPVRGKILSHFGAKSGGLFNDGINIGASRGTMVRAAENGVVAYAGNEVKGMGNLVIIQHSGGWMTVYAHMDSLAVRRGVRVKVGQKIGTVGATGKVTQPQLHFEIRKGTKAYNPSSYLKS